MNLKNRQQLLGIVAITAVALLVGDRLIFSPLTRSWKARSERIVALKESVRKGQAILDRGDSLSARWSGMRTNTLLGPVSAAENQMLKAFDRWSQASRIGISSIKPQKRETDDYVTMECRVEASGALPALTRFLYEIEHDPLALRVEGVEITARDGAGEQLGLSLQVSGLLLNPNETETQ